MSRIGDIDDGRRILAIMRGFKWDNQSCAYDALFTSLWIIYFLGNEELRMKIFEALPLLANEFDKMLKEITTFNEANLCIRDNYFITVTEGPLQANFDRGHNQDVSDLVFHLLKKAMFSEDNNVKECFMLKFNCCKICVNVSCQNKAQEIIHVRQAQILNFDADINTNKSMSDMITQYFSQNKRKYYCKECKLEMLANNVVFSWPQIMCICFNGANMKCNFDKVLVLDQESYDLASVTYLIGAHFRVRFNINNIVYEYDGMIRNGTLIEVKGEHLFRGIYYDDEFNPNDEEIFMKAVAVFYVKTNK